MKNYIMLNGKKIELSDETARNMAEQFKMSDKSLVEGIEDKLEDYFNISLYKNDETFSDVWGKEFTLQTIKEIAQRIADSLVLDGERIRESITGIQDGTWMKTTEDVVKAITENKNLIKVKE